MLNAKLVTQKFNSTDLKKQNKKKPLFTGFYNNIQRPIKRDRERKRQREVKGEYKNSRGEREEESETQGTKSRAVERTREVKESNM